MRRKLRHLIPALVGAGILVVILMSPLKVGDTHQNIIQPNHIQNLEQTPITPEDTLTPDVPVVKPPSITPPIISGPIDPATCTHVYIAKPSVVTCTTPGGTVYTCGLCGDSYTKDYEPPHGHTYEEYILEGNCFESGKIMQICIWCKTTQYLGSSNTVSHAWGEWKIQRYATPFESGVHTRTCYLCKTTETELYDVLPEGDTITIPELELSLPFLITQHPPESVTAESIYYTINGGSILFMPIDKQFRQLYIGQSVFVMYNNIVYEYQVWQHMLYSNSYFEEPIMPEPNTLYIYLYADSGMPWCIELHLVQSKPLFE